MLLNNRYRILRSLGRGGFGETFLAEDTYLPSSRPCVIKQLKPMANNPQPQLIQDRFQREAAVLEQLGEGHSQIPKLYAYFSENDQFYLVQEWIEGQTLTDKIRQQGIQSETAVREILVSLLHILDYVHNQRIIHRDIKPDNIILRQRDSQPVLIDFGAVKEAIATAFNPQGNSVHSMVIGTPGFMSPEQATGRPVYSSDLYSLGLTAIYLLTGKLPQELGLDPQTGEIIWRQIAVGVSPSLATVLDRAIQPRPIHRYATPREMLDALQLASPTSAAMPVTQPTLAVSPVAPRPVHPGFSPKTVPAIQSPARQGQIGERRVGKECLRLCRSRWSPYH